MQVEDHVFLDFFKSTKKGFLLKSWDIISMGHQYSSDYFFSYRPINVGPIIVYVYILLYILINYKQLNLCLLSRHIGTSYQTQFRALSG